MPFLLMVTLHRGRLSPQIQKHTAEKGTIPFISEEGESQAHKHLCSIHEPVLDSSYLEFISYEQPVYSHSHLERKLLETKILKLR